MHFQPCPQKVTFLTSASHFRLYRLALLLRRQSCFTSTISHGVEPTTPGGWFGKKMILGWVCNK